MLYFRLKYQNIAENSYALFFLMFFKAKKLLGADEKQLGVRERLMAGSMAGVASQTSIYPLEVT